MSPCAIMRILTRSIGAWRVPQSGAPRPALGRLVRIGVVSPYTIIHEYIEADDVVTIMRILHGTPPNHPPHVEPTDQEPMI